MPDVRSFLPLYSETLARIRARMDADANAGLQPGDPAWIDTREGSFYWDMTQVAALEIARLWDAIGSETVAAAFPSVAWGDYLDEHAATFGLVRNPAARATGFVTFIGQPETLVASGVYVSAEPADPSLDAIQFRVLASDYTSLAVPPPAPVTATPSASGGSLPAATYIYHLTSYNEFGESMAGADVPAVTTGTTGQVTLSWSVVGGAIGYRIYRSLTAGTPTGQLIADLNSTSFVDRGIVAPGALEPGSDTTSGVTLPVEAVLAGSAGNLAAYAIGSQETLLPTITLIHNTDPTVGGADVEEDEPFRLRILAQYSGQGGGNMNDYVKWMLAFPGVERAVCVPIWNGPGTVLAVPMLSDGSPVNADVVVALQAQLDPVTGLGHGQAPIGATVTVSTTSPLSVILISTVNFGTGYSLDGTSGTIATRAEINLALFTYFNSLNPGDTIRVQQVQAAIVSVEGVAGVTGMTINGGTVDIALTTAPPQTAALQTPVLT